MLALDSEHQLQLSVSDFVGRSVAELGITGSGKTNTAAVIIEELLSSGLPMTICDIEGEYYGLKQHYNLLIAGRSEHAELEVTPTNAPALARASVERGLSVILDLSDYTQDEVYAFLIAYFTALWEVASKVKKPYQIVLEEAHEFVPQSTNSPLKQILTRIALRGRKRGLGILMMSQRSAKVDKDVLTQASLLFLHKVVHPTDMRVYQDLIPLPSAQVEEMVRALQLGQAIVVSDHTPRIVQMRLRHTFHAGSTPTLEEVAQPELRRVDESLLRDLQQMMAASSSGGEENKLRRAERRIGELEALLKEKDKEIARQAEQIGLLSKLSVSIDANTIPLPEYLQINRAAIDAVTVHQVLLPEGEAAVIEAVPQRPVAVVSPPLVPLNKRKVANIRSRLSKLPKRERDILNLVRQYEKGLSVYEIAAWLNITESSVRKNPPLDLLKMGLLSRVSISSGHLYSSTLKEFVAREFPGTDQDEVLKQLFEE